MAPIIRVAPNECKSTDAVLSALGTLKLTYTEQNRKLTNLLRLLVYGHYLDSGCLSSVQLLH